MLEWATKPLVAANSKPRCLGDSASRLSISLRLKGRAAPTRSGSSSPVKVDPPEARALPNWFTAIRLTEQAVDTTSIRAMTGVFIAASLSLGHDQFLGFLEEAARFLIPTVPMTRQHLTKSVQVSPRLLFLPEPLEGHGAQCEVIGAGFLAQGLSAADCRQRVGESPHAVPCRRQSSPVFCIAGGQTDRFLGVPESGGRGFGAGATVVHHGPALLVQIGSPWLGTRTLELFGVLECIRLLQTLQKEVLQFRRGPREK